MIHWLFIYAIQTMSAKYDLTNEKIYDKIEIEHKFFARWYLFCGAGENDDF